MSRLEIVMQSVGWLGMVMILVGLGFGMDEERRTFRQVTMSIGAGLLGIMSAIPEIKPIFFYLQIGVCIVGFLNIRDGMGKVIPAIILVFSTIGAAFALHESVGVETWIGIAGLVAIALGYGAPTPLIQYLWMGIGGLVMAVYSSFGVAAGVWQAWPFLVLNIPFMALGLKGFYEELGKYHKAPST